MQIGTISSLVLQAAANDRRRVVSDWRICIYARRVAVAENVPVPDLDRCQAVLADLLRKRSLKLARGVEGVYTAEVPYANLLEVSEEQIVQEANPWAMFGFRTAMVYHGLTDLPPTEIQSFHSQAGHRVRRLPLGTMPEDWVEFSMPAPRQPRKCGGTPVVWTSLQAGREFGVMIGYSSGLPIYVTDAERTLLDALRMPEKCGGIAKVLWAWRGVENLDVGRLVEYTELYDIQVLRQRVGYLLERLGCQHPQLEEWRGRLQRGGSMKLVAGEPYAEKFSAEWNLSLNVPASVLAILD